MYVCAYITNNYVDQFFHQICMYLMIWYVKILWYTVCDYTETGLYVYVMTSDFCDRGHKIFHVTLHDTTF